MVADGPARAGRTHSFEQFGPTREFFGQVLGEQVGNVDAEPVDAAIAPEAQRLEEVGADLRVVPVPVGLLGREQVQVPLPVGHRVHAGPPKNDLQSAGGSSPFGPEPSRKMYRSRSAEPHGAAERGLKPRVPIRAVVRDDVDDHLDVAPVQRGDHLVELSERADRGVDVAVVVDVVTAVDQSRRIERAQPHGIDAEPVEVVDPADDAVQITDAVTVRVGEAARVDLIHRGLPPPVRLVGFHDRSVLSDRETCAGCVA